MRCHRCAGATFRSYMPEAQWRSQGCGWKHRCAISRFSVPGRSWAVRWPQHNAAGEDRTPDLRIMKPTRCQLRYCRERAASKCAAVLLGSMLCQCGGCGIGIQSGPPIEEHVIPLGQQVVKQHNKLRNMPHQNHKHQNATSATETTPQKRFEDQNRRQPACWEASARLHSAHTVATRHTTSRVSIPHRHTNSSIIQPTIGDIALRTSRPIGARQLSRDHKYPLIAGNELATFSGWRAQQRVSNEKRSQGGSNSRP